MKNYLLIVAFLGIFFSSFSQQTKVFGKVTDEVTGETLPFVKVKFYLSKMGTSTDTIGRYSIETYYATDSLQFVFLGYKTKTVAVKLDQSQEINITLKPDVEELETFFVRPPDELPSITLHKKIIANKRINNKEKLTSYDYEVYNKIINLQKKLIKKNIVKLIDGKFKLLKYKNIKSNYNSKKKFKKICKLNLNNKDTFGKHIKLLRALSHKGFKNAYYIHNKKKIYLELKLSI
jgi:HrpA-like RNA helicase